MSKASTLAYYTRQSAITDPGPYAALYDGLPDDVAGLARVVQGLIMMPYVRIVSWYGVRPEDLELLGPTGYGVRSMAETLARLRQRAAAPLNLPRPPEERLGANCRNFGTLLVSLLRHQQVPARLRVGFGGYFPGDIAYDHRITEYWDATQRRWLLADSMLDAVQCQRRGITFDPLDIPAAEHFYHAADVWQRCRAGEWDAQRFGDSETDRGIPPIRYALLHDFAALNKLEVLGCDDWGDLIVKPEQDLTGDDLALLDRIADLILQADEQLPALLDLFAASAYGQAVLAQLGKAA